VIILNTEKIKNLRDELEITQEDISKVLGCTRTAYSLWEINKNTIPLYYLNKISNEYNINIDYLVDLSNDKYIKFNKVDINRINLGKKIKEARKSINYTQEKLASKLNTTHSVISAYESGKSTVSTLFLIEIAKITKKSLNWFLNKI
jgi:transcriptional regulator with XRE-family HTH domain